MKPRTFLLLVVCAAVLSPAWAQEKTAPPAPATAPPAVTVDANAVRRNLYDLALLRALQAVNFDAAQIKSLQTVVKETLETDKERRKKDDDAMREIATDVEKAHTGALAGEPIPPEVETKYIEKQKAVLARIGAAKREYVENILAVLYPTLTASQKTEMEKQSLAFYGTKRIPAKYRDKPETAPRDAVLQLAAGAFVENVLLDDRMPALLASLKPLKASGEPAAKP
ncbi:MAG: hypothetical protein H7Y38_16430 [Armatimonadetes bacterium]|nr:hypothetical protein [Armatimonadota bacterium]